MASPRKYGQTTSARSAFHQTSLAKPIVNNQPPSHSAEGDRLDLARSLRLGARSASQASCEREVGCVVILESSSNNRTRHTGHGRHRQTWSFGRW